MKISGPPWKWHVEGQMVSELILVPTTFIFIFIYKMLIRRTNTYEQWVYFITTARILPIATLHLANNQIRAANDAEDSKARATLEEVFGCVKGDYSVQVIGAIKMRAGQLITSPDVNEYPCVVFPNLIEQNGAEILTIPWGATVWHPQNNSWLLIPYRNNVLCNSIQSTYNIWQSENVLGLHIKLYSGSKILTY